MSSLQWDEIEEVAKIKFPRDDPLEYPVPVMGPLPGEGPMEPFGRAWEILKYFNTVKVSAWEARFATAACIRNAPIVENRNLPAWMQQTEAIDQEMMDSPMQEPEFSHAIKVELIWDHSVPFDEKQALTNALDKAEKDKTWIPPYSLIRFRFCFGGCGFKFLDDCLPSCIILIAVFI